MCINEPKEKAQLAVPGNANVWTDAKRIHVQTVVHKETIMQSAKFPKWWTPAPG